MGGAPLSATLSMPRFRIAPALFSILIGSILIGWSSLARPVAAQVPPQTPDGSKPKPKVRSSPTGPTRSTAPPAAAPSQPAKPAQPSKAGPTAPGGKATTPSGAGTGTPAPTEAKKSFIASLVDFLVGNAIYIVLALAVGL